MRPGVHWAMNPADWTYSIEAMKPSILGRYRVYLSVELGMRYGAGDGWGWGRWTLRGARAKGERELAKYRRNYQRLAERQRRIGGE